MESLAARAEERVAGGEGGGEEEVAGAVTEEGSVEGPEGSEGSRAPDGDCQCPGLRRRIRNEVAVMESANDGYSTSQGHVKKLNMDQVLPAPIYSQQLG